MDAVSFQILFNIACVLVGALGTIVLKGIFDRMKELAAEDKNLAEKQVKTTGEVHELALSLAKNYPTKEDMRDMRAAVKEMQERIDESFAKVMERIENLADRRNEPKR